MVPELGKAGLGTCAAGMAHILQQEATEQGAGTQQKGEGAREDHYHVK